MSNWQKYIMEKVRSGLFFGRIPSDNSNPESTEETYHEQELIVEINQQLWMYFGSIVLLLGLVGNTLCLYVLCRRRMRKLIVGSYLITLTTSHLVGTMTSVLRMWIYFFFRVDFFVASAPLCKPLIFLQNFSKLCSSWMVVTITIERTVLICRPFVSVAKRPCFLTPTAILNVVALLLTLVVSPELYYVQVEGNVCTAAKTYFTGNITWEFLEALHYTFYSFLPSVIIIPCSLIIAFKLRFNRWRCRDNLEQTSCPRIRESSLPTISVVSVWLPPSFLARMSASSSSKSLHRTSGHKINTPTISHAQATNEHKTIPLKVTVPQATAKNKSNRSTVSYSKTNSEHKKNLPTVSLHHITSEHNTRQGQHKTRSARASFTQAKSQHKNNPPAVSLTKITNKHKTNQSMLPYSQAKCKHKIDPSQASLSSSTTENMIVPSTPLPILNQLLKDIPSRTSIPLRSSTFVRDSRATFSRHHLCRLRHNIWIVLIINIIFLVTTTPVCILRFLILFGDNLDQTSKHLLFYGSQIATLFSDMNIVINLIVFIGSGKAFRNELKTLDPRMFRKKQHFPSNIIVCAINSD